MQEQEERRSLLSGAPYLSLRPNTDFSMSGRQGGKLKPLKVFASSELARRLTDDISGCEEGEGVCQ